MTTPATNEVTILLRSRESAERTAREIVERQIEREKLIAARDAEIELINATHNPSIDVLTDAIDFDFARLEDWAAENKEEFGDAKSIVLCGHRLGWRLGQPTVKPRGKLTLKAIVAQIVKIGGDLKARFIREKPELNKEAILALNRIAEGRDPATAALPADKRAAAQAEARATLKQLGVQVSQTEAFYFEPDRDGQPDIRLTGDAKEAA